MRTEGIRTAGWWALLAAGAAIAAASRPHASSARPATSAAAARGLAGAPQPQADLQSAYARLPLSFEANEGQFDGRIDFVARGKGYSLALSAGEAVLSLRTDSAQGRPPKGHPRRAESGNEGPWAARVKSSVPASRGAANHRSQHRTGAGRAVSPSLPQYRKMREPGPPSAADPAAASERRSPSPHRLSALRTSAANSAGQALLSMKLIGGNRQAQAAAGEPLLGRVNYFLGNDPTKWRTNIPTHRSIRYREVYPGIDLVYYGNQGQLEYDFIVAPGADPGRIRFGVEGAVQVSINAQGDLVLQAPRGDLIQHAPVVYQEINGRRQPVEGGYVLARDDRRQSMDRRRGTAGAPGQGRGSARTTGRLSPVVGSRCSAVGHPSSVVRRLSSVVALCLGAYDHSRPLVIDPTLVYSTYLGGNLGDEGTGIAVDSLGSAYVVGVANSTNFPTMSPFQPAAAGNQDAFIAKLTPDGSQLVYSTYLGGKEFEESHGIAVDGSGNACVTGTTASIDFPVANAILPAKPGGAGGVTAFVTKLNASGSALIFSTYLGGTGFRDEGWGIGADAGGNTYVAGFTQSGDFPVTVNAFQPVAHSTMQGFVTKFDPAGGLAYSSFLGGSGDSDAVFALAVDTSGNAYVTGQTNSLNFPVRNALQPAHAGGFYDAFVTEVNPAGTALVYSTYLGGGADIHGNGGSDEGEAIAVDPSGKVYVAGSTDSPSFPTTPGAFQSARGSMFVTKLSTGGGALVYSTYFGTSGTEGAHGIAADGSGSAYVVGSTLSASFPVKDSMQPFRGGSYAFVIRFDPAGGVDYSTLLGGASSGRENGLAIAVDQATNAYVTGGTSSADFPTVNPFQPALAVQPAGFSDAYVSKINPSNAPPATHLGVAVPADVTSGEAFNFTVTALDASNKVVPGYTGTIHFTSSDLAPGVILPPDYTFVPADNGTHSFSATLETTGNQTLTATDTANAAIKGSATLNVHPLHFKIDAPATATAATPFDFTVTVQDFDNNTVASYAGTVHFTSSDPQRDLPADYAFTAADNGSHKFSATLKTAGNQTLTATDTANNAITGSATVTVNPGPPHELQFLQQPTDTQAGKAISPAVRVRMVDSYGNTVTDAKNAVALVIGANPSGGTLSGTTSQAPVVGVATFPDLSIDKIGDGYTLVATAPGVAGAFPSLPFNVTGPPPARLDVAAPAVATKGVSFSLTVTALDAANGVAAGYRGRVHFTSSDPAAFLPPDYTFVAADAGRHRFDATLNTVGNQTLTATDTVKPAITGSANILVQEPPSLVVTTEADVVNPGDGVTSLREAILNANSLPGLNMITFKIPGAGVRVIKPASPLPPITHPVIIDGYTQPGAHPNTLGAWQGTNAVIKVYIDGGSAGSNANGLEVAADGSALRGLAIGRFAGGAAILLTGANTTLSGCFLGTNFAGQLPRRNETGVWVKGAGSTIGGITPAAVNVISGNDIGVRISDGGATANQVLGNLIGTNAGGTAALTNNSFFAGIFVDQAPGNTIGAASPGAGNVIAARGVAAGVYLYGPGCRDNLVQGNRIGTNAAGTAALPTGVGVFVVSAFANTIGGPGTGNLISGNTVAGVDFVTDPAKFPAESPANNIVQANLIGTNVTGFGALPNNNGVLLSQGATNNLIGGTTAAERNLISGNATAGVDVRDAGTSGNRVQGNFIGTNMSGSAALANGSGIILESGGSTVGGEAVGAGNVISGNQVRGILLNGAGATGNRVQGNRIGVNLADMPVPNQGSGVVFRQGAHHNMIGGPSPASGNLISGNRDSGVFLPSEAGPGNLIQENLIGTATGGTRAVANGRDGVEIQTANTTVGGPAAGNLISGNAGDGILIVLGSGNQIQGNAIGTNGAGIAALPNGGSGIEIAGGAANNLVGGPAPAFRNVISGNTRSGVYIHDPGSAGNQILGNYIGTNTIGSAALVAPPGYGSQPGVEIDAPDNVVGGPGAGNLISGNGAGITVAADRTRVQANKIGTDAAGLRPVPNTGWGIATFGASNSLIGGVGARGEGNLISGNGGDAVGLVVGGGNRVQGNVLGLNAAGSSLANFWGVFIHGDSKNNLVGGTSAGLGNVISGNTFAGVEISDNNSTGNQVQGNLIGTDASGGTARPNGDGILIDFGAANNVIGGSSPGAGNLISGNARDGILISGAGVSADRVQGNSIGLSAGGAALPNAGHGVEIASKANSNSIGGATAAEGNDIAYNLGAGVAVMGKGTISNAVRANRILNNGALGIDLGGDGVTPNDPNGGPRAGPNRFQNYPVITSAVASGASLTVTGRLKSVPSARFVVDIYLNGAADASGHGQGAIYQGSTVARTNPAGNAVFNVSFPVAASGMFVTGTASRIVDPGVYETSEFSQAVEAR